jgi:hypothetical protein
MQLLICKLAVKHGASFNLLADGAIFQNNLCLQELIE